MNKDNVELHQIAYCMELETIVNYLASVNLDGVRAEEIKQIAGL